MLRPARPYLVRHGTGHRGPRPRDRMPHDRLPAAAVSVPCCRIQRLDASPGGRRHHLHRHTGRQPPCDRPFEPRLRPQRRKPVLQTQLYERFQLRVLRPRRKRLGRYDRPRIFGALCLQKELLADDAPRQADAGQIHQRHHDRGKRHTLDRQPLQRPAGLQQPGIRNTVAYDGEQPAHAATRKQRHHGAPLRLIRAAVGQHRRPDRGVHHGTRKHPQPHAAARPGPCQPILRRRPPEGMGRHAFGTRLLGRDPAAGSRVQRVRRTGCRAARRLHDAGRRVRTGYLHRRYPAIRRPALYRNGRQHDRHSPAPPHLPLLRQRRFALDRYALGRTAALPPAAGIPKLHAPGRIREQRNRRHYTGPPGQHLGRHLLRTFAHHGLDGTGHHLLPVRQAPDPAVLSPLFAQHVDDDLLRRQHRTGAVRAGPRHPQNHQVARAAGADRNQDQQHRPASLGRQSLHQTAERHQTHRPQPQAAQHRHQLRSRDVPFAGEGQLRLPALRRRDRRGVELCRKPPQRQLRTPARRALHLRTEGPEPRRILERRAAAAGNRHQAFTVADVVRPPVLHRRGRRSRLVCQPALPAPPAAKNGARTGPHGAGTRKGAHQHEDRLLHQHIPRTAHAALADLRSGKHAAGHHR